ncbi:hypothetical protein I317_06739 [Kwoniella heveanensis CBS 569]|nr:hypothetical protein I317_06739 [Kwoniella heveanensis CBS 569]
MSQPIPTNKKPRSLSLASHQFQRPDASTSESALLTPGGTPPPNTAGIPHGRTQSHGAGGCDPAVEARLKLLLANFDSGTHSFCREERETPEERRMSFGSGSDVFPTPPSSRRPSFLSSLSLSRPFSFTSSASASPASSFPSTPVSTSHHNPHQAFHKELSNLHMTSTSSSSMGVADHMAKAGPTSSGVDFAGPRPAIEPNSQVQSSPNVPISQQIKERGTEDGLLPSMMNRSKTTSQLPVKQSGFVPPPVSASPPLHAQIDGKRHFDPSREPKLLGLL